MSLPTSGMHLEGFPREGVVLHGDTRDYSNLGNHPHLREGWVAVTVTDSPSRLCDGHTLRGCAHEE